jgi:uncharacterized protein YqjF (DUF2071 family)
MARHGLYGSAAARQVAGLARTAHRPWPLPAAPWVMGQTWTELLFAHWSVRPDVVRPLVPAPLDLDVRDGRAYIGVTPFAVTGLRPRGLPPPPYLSRFPELNVRTYVRLGDRPGILFFSLDAARRAAVAVARLVYRLPYRHAAMQIRSSDGQTSYRSVRRTPDRGTFVGTYRRVGPVVEPQPGSLEAFLVERYCLYTSDRGRILRADIHHPPWPVQRAEARIEVNTVLPVPVSDDAPLLHAAARQDVLVWPPRRVA